MQLAAAGALLGDRSPQPIFRAELKTRAEITAKSLNAIPGMSCVAPIAGFYVMPQLTLPAGKTDVDYVLGLLRATGVLCVYGSGFGMPADGGFFRVVFLASPEELADIYRLMASFTQQFV